MPLVFCNHPPCRRRGCFRRRCLARCRRRWVVAVEAVVVMVVVVGVVFVVVACVFVFVLVLLLLVLSCVSLSSPMTCARWAAIVFAVPLRLPFVAHEMCAMGSDIAPSAPQAATRRPRESAYGWRLNSQCPSDCHSAAKDICVWAAPALPVPLRLPFGSQGNLHMGGV